jgi:hypothetical protein
MITVPKGTRKETASMENKVFILWYRNTFTHETHMWGIYGTRERAQEARKVADKMDYITWINEEEVQ